VIRRYWLLLAAILLIVAGLVLGLADDSVLTQPLYTIRRPN
jgi:hypothetical protein